MDWYRGGELGLELSTKQREKLSQHLRLIISVISGGIMITFANFTILTGLTNGTSFLILMVLIGLLIGMYSLEIQFAILSGIFSIFVGFLIFYGVILIPIIVFATWELFDILVLFGVFVIVRIIMLELVGIMLGAMIGRWIGPAWEELSIPMHKLRIGVNGKTEEE